ncbi:hypothetical protein OAO84_00705 [Candidatus Marinimicrobia bacterium]|nr:hypothetical protein [Candidatus Neomarinimicrobiota bacterium]
MDTFDLNQVDEVISPCCDEEIKTSEIGAALKCPLCKANLKQRIYLPFLEYLMENGHVENLDFFDLDLYSQDKESLDSEDEELDLDKYETKKDSLNIYENDSKFTSTAKPSETSIDESAVSSDWTKFAMEDSDS